MNKIMGAFFATRVICRAWAIGLGLIMGSLFAFVDASAGARDAESAVNAELLKSRVCHEARRFVFFSSTYSFEAMLAGLECRLLNAEEGLLRLESQYKKHTAQLDTNSEHGVDTSSELDAAAPSSSGLDAPPSELDDTIRALSQKRELILRQHEQQHREFVSEWAQRRHDLAACQLGGAAQELASKWARRMRRTQYLCTR